LDKISDYVLVFTARRYASAVYAIVVSVCVSVTPGIVSKRLNLESRKQRRMIALEVTIVRRWGY